MRILYLVLFSSLVVGSSSAQIASSELSSESDIDYFLKQAFFAKTSADRVALNHIGIESKKTEGGHLITAVLEGYPHMSNSRYAAFQKTGILPSYLIIPENIQP